MTSSSYRASQHALFAVLEHGTSTTTTVPLRQLYVGAATCLSVIHLLARDLANDILRQVVAPLREIDPSHYWYPVEDLHLTIKNIRSAVVGRRFVNPEIHSAVTALQAAAPRLTTLNFELLGPICLPASIVIRAFGDLDHRDAVLDLDKQLDAAGMADDKRYASGEIFVGNITVCRFTEPPSQSLRARVSAQTPLCLGTYRVDSLQLVQCDEVCSSVSRKIHESIALPDKPLADDAPARPAFRR